MSAYRYAVRVRQHPSVPGVWTWDCPCGALAGWRLELPRTHREAAQHAATCPDLHWANWAAACRSCKTYGRVAPACPVCLGRGYEAEREDLS